ncbi:MAG: LysR family transcriptional regulator [Myxococcota bacterium]|nr:LysR family transcriptional regulator [Myxococcota bacterium]
MQSVDLELLASLDALLAEGSVRRAARRLGVSEPAMSRRLTRLRDLAGDPLMVRAGRGLVPTPRALSLREPIRALLDQAGALFEPVALPLESLERTFVLRANDALVGTLAPLLADAVHREAPHVTLRFAPEGDAAPEPLREGRIDLDLGVLAYTSPEIKVQELFRDRMVGVVRKGHPLESGRLTLARLCAFPHVSASRRGRARGPIDALLDERGLAREVRLVVPTFYAAVFVAAGSDLVAVVPGRLASAVSAELGLSLLRLPQSLPALRAQQAWHPRQDADPAHRWLRDRILRTCRALAKGAPGS